MSSLIGAGCGRGIALAEPGARGGSKMSDLPSPAEAGFAKAGGPHAQRGRGRPLGPPKVHHEDTKGTKARCAGRQNKAYAWAGPVRSLLREAGRAGVGPFCRGLPCGRATKSSDGPHAQRTSAEVNRRDAEVTRPPPRRIGSGDGSNLSDGPHAKRGRRCVGATYRWIALDVWSTRKTRNSTLSHFAYESRFHTSLGRVRPCPRSGWFYQLIHDVKKRHALNRLSVEGTMEHSKNSRRHCQPLKYIFRTGKVSNEQR
jgi:hypothetical protein